MKKTNLILFAIVLLALACSKHSVVKKEERVVITLFHITTLMMRPVDSIEVRNQGIPSLPYDQVFLSKEQFALFEKNIWKAFRDSTTLIYQNGGMKEKPMDKKEFLAYRKDWHFGHFTTIACYETWYFNPQNNMIERDVLGYSLMEYVPEKEAYRLMGDVFKNEVARKRVNDNYFTWY
jgi:hypothetical protein